MGGCPGWRCLRLWLRVLRWFTKLERERAPGLKTDVMGAVPQRPVPISAAMSGSHKPDCLQVPKKWYLPASYQAKRQPRLLRPVLVTFSQALGEYARPNVEHLGFQSFNQLAI